MYKIRLKLHWSIRNILNSKNEFKNGRISVKYRVLKSYLDKDNFTMREKTDVHTPFQGLNLFHQFGTERTTESSAAHPEPPREETPSCRYTKNEGVLYSCSSSFRQGPTMVLKFKFALNFFNSLFCTFY